MLTITCVYGQDQNQEIIDVQEEEAEISDDNSQDASQQDEIVTGSPLSQESPSFGNDEKEIVSLIDNFEDAGLWQGDMPRDYGVIRVMRREGNSSQTEGDYVLGAKVSFFKTGTAWFSLVPPRETFIEGKVTKLKIRVVGRGFNHELKAVVRDILGNTHMLSFGKLIHRGWEPEEGVDFLELQIPENVIQEHIRSSQKGIYFESLVVDCNMSETFGNYYVYFDDLNAEVNVENLDDIRAERKMDDW